VVDLEALGLSEPRLLVADGDDELASHGHVVVRGPDLDLAVGKDPAALETVTLALLPPLAHEDGGLAELVALDVVHDDGLRKGSAVNAEFDVEGCLEGLGAVVPARVCADVFDGLLLVAQDADALEALAAVLLVGDGNHVGVGEEVGRVVRADLDGLERSHDVARVLAFLG
jgi:hypothetical protein